jgi:hypothetical protein
MFFRISVFSDGLSFALCLASPPGDSPNEKRSRHRQRDGTNQRRKIFPHLDWTLDRSFAGPAPALTSPDANVRERAAPGGSGMVRLDFIFAAGSAGNILPIFIQRLAFLGRLGL